MTIKCLKIQTSLSIWNLSHPQPNPSAINSSHVRNRSGSFHTLGSIQINRGICLRAVAVEIAGWEAVFPRVWSLGAHYIFILTASIIVFQSDIHVKISLVGVYCNSNHEPGVFSLALHWRLIGTQQILSETTLLCPPQSARSHCIGMCYTETQCYNITFAFPVNIPY